VKTSLYIVPSLRRTVSVPVRQTSNAPAAAWTRVPFSVFHMLQSSAAVHWSVRTVVRQGNETMHAVHRPTARPLYRGRYVSCDIKIWNTTIYRLACWATIWLLVELKDDTDSALQTCFSLLHMWFINNGLSLNAEKSKAIICSSRQNSTSISQHTDVSLAGSKIAVSPKIKSLGVTFDSSSTQPCYCEV